MRSRLTPLLVSAAVLTGATTGCSPDGLPTAGPDQQASVLTDDQLAAPDPASDLASLRSPADGSTTTTTASTGASVVPMPPTLSADAATSATDTSSTTTPPSTTTTTPTVTTTSTTVASTTTVAEPSSTAGDPGATPTTTTPPAGGDVLTSGESDSLARLNQLRSGLGLNALARDAEMDAFARNWSRQMAESGSFEHSNGPYGENIAFTSNTRLTAAEAAELFHQLWVDSPGHYRNMTNDGYTQTGIGLYRTDRGWYGTHVFRY